MGFQLKLKKLTPVVSKKNIYAFCDFFIDFDGGDQILVKGVVAKLSNNFLVIMFPARYTEGENKVRYSVFVFPRKEDIEKFSNQARACIQKDYPLTKWSEGIFNGNT
jgi:hypothetical protein